MKSKIAQNSEVLSSSLIHLAEGYVTVITICSWSFIEKKCIIKEFFVYLKDNQGATKSFSKNQKPNYQITDLVIPLF